MGTTDANGIYFYEETDSVSPLHTLLNVGQQSVSNALNDSVRIYPVPSVSARNALAATSTPSTSNPLIVFRGNAAPGRQIEFTVDGTNWFTEPNPSPSTWRFARAIATDASFSGGGNTVLINGTITAAPPGVYAIRAQAALYAPGGAGGWIVAEAGASEERARWDLTPSVASPTVELIYTHSGGNLTVACSYNRTSGTAVAAGTGGGVTTVTATHLAY